MVEAGEIGRPVRLWSATRSGMMNTGTHCIDFQLYVLGNAQAKWVMGAVERHTDRHIFGHRVEDRCVGIIGYGAIGRRIADLCIALGMEVSVYDPYVRISNGNVRQVDLDRVLSHPLFVVFAAYATSETRHMMNRAAFGKMRRDAYFVNISRGITVDEDALYEALTTGIIAGAGLDVGQGIDEQPSLRIAQLPNVYAVPHVAGLTREASDHQAFETIRQVKEILSGRAPALALNPEAWTRRRLVNAGA